jgi:hypothetical protein
MKKIFILIGFATISLFWLSSCEYNTIEPEQAAPVTSATFSADVWPLFESNGCATCHVTGFNNFDASTQAKAYTSLTTNNLVSLPSPSCSLMLHIKAKHNGTANFSVNDIAKITWWIDNGALNN